MAGSHIIAAMRRWLLLLMVLLLPLRGWVGEAMAGQMLQQHVKAVASVAIPAPAAHAHGHGHGHDCDQPVQAVAVADAPQDEAAAAPAGTDCPTCASCQACSSVALSPPVWAPAGASFSQPPPQALPLRYASADTALAFKPPRG